MSTLSHTTKVTVRRALKTLQRADAIRTGKIEGIEDRHIDPMVTSAHQELVHHVVIKAGFRNRSDLEAFARKHHLL